MRYIELESERLRFRKFRRTDFPVVFDWLSNAENMKYRSGEPKSEAEAQDYLDWAIRCAEAENCVNFRYAVELKDSHTLIGSCELYFTDQDPAYLAWELHRNYWRQGYGTEIGETLLRLGFEMLELRRICADCNALNRGSYRIMEKIGMRREGHFVKSYRGNSVLNHIWCDRYQYAILREEWLNTNRRMIQRCTEESVPAVGAFYDEVVLNMDAHNANYPKWEYKIYPSVGSVRERTQHGVQYFCKENGRICGAFVLSDDPGGAYEKGSWSCSLERGEYLVIHALAADPNAAGTGIGQHMVRFCMDLARLHGCKGIRLDVVPDNLPAIRLYEKMGFTLAGEADLERGIEAIPVFRLYEYNFISPEEEHHGKQNT